MLLSILHLLHALGIPFFRGLSFMPPSLHFLHAASQHLVPTVCPIYRLHDQKHDVSRPQDALSCVNVSAILLCHLCFRN